MFNKFFKFLKGYVIIDIYGSDTERFINICVKRNIKLYYLRYCQDGSIESCVDKNSFALLRPVAFKTKTRVRIKKKKGLFNLYRRYGGRYALITGAIMCALFFVVSSQFIWAVEIEGIENADYETVVKSLEKSGIYPGARKSKIDDIAQVKKRILRENENISWAWVYVEGSKARLEVYEKIIPPQVFDRNLPCDIIAATDGYIKNIILKNGHSEFKAGDTVTAGETVISGKVPLFKEGEEEKYMYTHASGIIEAYTTHKAKGRYRTYYQSDIFSGKEKRRYTLELFGKEFPLFINHDTGYEDYNVYEKRYELNIPFRGYSGIALNTVTIQEVSRNREPLSLEAVIDFAENELEEKISKELMYDASLINRELKYNYIDDETLEVELIMDFIEKIGTEKLTEETEELNIVDKQTD